jgi:beta-lactamase class A
MGSEDSECQGELANCIAEIVEGAGAEGAGVAFHDYANQEKWSLCGDEWFHAASTIKVPVLVGIFAAIEKGDFTLESRVHVRNQFQSVVDGEPFRVDASRDADAEVYSQIGKTMKIGDLARHMIVTSSNLATNLLIDAVGLDPIRDKLAELGVDGIDLQRGVEDELAYEKGIINRVTANGLVKVLRLIEEKEALAPELCDAMLEILHAQEFRSGIPAGLPDDARVANKTGEISTVAHDTGLVYLPDRAPYAITILSRWKADRTSGRRDTLAKISRAVYERLTRAGAGAGE